MDHGSVIGTCNSCHDGAIATGKSVTHINSSIRVMIVITVLPGSPVAQMDHGSVMVPVTVVTMVQ